MIKPLPIDPEDRQKRLDEAVQKVNDKITEAKKYGFHECSFPICNDEPFYKEIKEMFTDAGYHIYINIYARCGGVVEDISW